MKPARSRAEGSAAAAAEPRSPLLELRDVRCGIAGSAVLHGISMTLAAGELGCLLGPSGCGKTTLLRGIAGFQPLSGGTIRLRGTPVSGEGAAVPPERRGVGYVFQDLALFPHLDVASNVAFGLHRMARTARAARVAESLSLLGLEALARRYPHELSGGQQQRVALARSLAPQPDLLLLDEPFSSLDAHLRIVLREELRGLLKRLGLAALLVTHDQDEAFAFADRVGVMQAGRLEQWQPGFEVYHRPASAFVARFVGEGRFLRGRMLDDGRVETALGRFAASSPPGERSERVHVLIRPDDVQPDAAGPIEAVVVASTFRGAESFHTLRLPDGEEISALFPSHLQFAVDERIRVRIDLEHVVVFPAA